MGETFPHFKRLSSVFIADSYRQEILSQIRGDLDSEKLVDLISLVASSFTTADIDLLLEDVKLGECERLGDDWILTPNGLTHAKELFNALVNERADKAATKKVVTIITEDDVAKEDDEVKSVKVKKGPTGGGRGAREAKTKGKDKKRKKKEEEKEDSGGPLTEDEITGVVEDDELFSTLDEEARQALGMFSILLVLHLLTSICQFSSNNAMFLNNKAQFSRSSTSDIVKRVPGSGNFNLCA